MTEQPGAAGRTRRTLLGASTAAAAAGVTALLGAGCGGKSQQPSLHGTSQALNDADIAILNQLLDLEYKAIAAYTAGAPLLDGPAHDAAQQFLEQELNHAGRLYSMVKQAGGKPGKAKASYQLGSPRTRTEVLRLLHQIEHAEVASYLGAIAVISQAPARATLASILANDAQHVTVLRSELGIEPLLTAFVTGGE